MICRSFSGSTSFAFASEPERLQLLDLLGMLRGEVVGLGAVDVGVEQLPGVVLEPGSMPAIGPCTVTAFQPSCQMPRLPSIS